MPSIIQKYTYCNTVDARESDHAITGGRTMPSKEHDTSSVVSLRLPDALLERLTVIWTGWWFTEARPHRVITPFAKPLLSGSRLKKNKAG